MIEFDHFPAMYDIIGNFQTHFILVKFNFGNGSTLKFNFSLFNICFNNLQKQIRLFQSLVHTCI